MIPAHLIVTQAAGPHIILSPRAVSPHLDELEYPATKTNLSLVAEHIISYHIILYYHTIT